MIPGEILIGSGALELNPGRATVRLSVKNGGDRPVQIGSHCHFDEVNAALIFDRYAAHSKRLNIAAGTTLRFEPGQTREVELVEYHAAGFDAIRSFGRIEIVERHLSVFLDADQVNNAATFYVLFTAMDEPGVYIKLNDSGIRSAIVEKKLNVVNFLTGEKYKLGVSTADMDGYDFVFKSFSTKNYVNVVEFASAAGFSGIATLAVMFKLSGEGGSGGQEVSTAFMAASNFERGAAVFQGSSGSRLSGGA